MYLRCSFSHMCRGFVLLVVLIVSFQAWADDVPKHLQLARELIENIKPENNKYDPQGYIAWKGDVFSSDYKVRAECGQFVGYMLDKGGSHAYSQLKSKTFWRRDPRSDNWYESVVKGYGFSNILDIREAKPGDVAVELYNKQIPLKVGGYAIGHVMLIDSIEQMEPDAPIVENTLQWKVVILDSTENPHGPTDTRFVPKDSGRDQVTGAGRGPIRIYTDSDGHVVGRAWSENPRTYHSIAEYPFVIGHPIE